MAQLGAATPFAVVTGDLNVGHREFDIRNWKGNRQEGGVPPPRAGLLRSLPRRGRRAGRRRRRLRRPGARLGRRRPHASTARSTARTPGGRAAARRSTTTPAGASTTTSRRRALAERVTDYRVARAPSWDTRWSDHAPVSSTTRSGSERALGERGIAASVAGLGLSGDQTPPVLRHAAVRRLPPDRQLHRGAHAVAGPAGGVRRVLLRRRPARADAAERPGRAAREDPPHRRAVHRRRHRAVEVDAVRAVARARRTPSSPGSSRPSPASARPAG